MSEDMETMGVVAALCLGGLAAVLGARGADARRRRSRRRAGDGALPGAAVPGIRVLLVDRDPALVALLSRMLGARGHHVITATSPAEARQLAAAHPDGVDVAVAGLDLGDHHGVAALGEVRRSSPRARGVILSEEVRHEEDVRHLLDAGVDLVRRPASPDALVAAVERAAARAPGPGCMR